MIVQRDTYFGVGEGRLKLREESPGEAHLIAYARPDDPAVRVSEYRIAPCRPRAAARALAASLGVHVVVDKRRRLLLWEDVRIHLDAVEGLGSFVELEAVAPTRAPTSGPSARRWPSCGRSLGIEDDALQEGSYADARGRGGGAGRPGAPRPGPRGRGPRLRAVLATSPSAPPCAPTTAAATRAPTSRTPPTRRASARRRSALGAMVAGGGGRDRRGRRRRPQRGGLRAVRRLPPAAARVRGARRRPSTSPTSGACAARRASASCCPCPSARTPRMTRHAPPRRSQRRAPGPRARGSASCSAPASARSPTSSRTRSRSRTPTSPASAPAPSRATRARSRSATLDGVPVACFQGRSHVYEGIEASAITTPIRTLRLLGAERLLLTNAAGSLRAGGRPGQPRRADRPRQPPGLQPARRPQRRGARPALPGLSEAYDPELRAGLHARRRRARHAAARRRLPRDQRPELRDARRDPRVPHARRRPRRHEHRARGDRRAPLRPPGRRGLRGHEPRRGHGRGRALARADARGGQARRRRARPPDARGGWPMPSDASSPRS